MTVRKRLLLVYLFFNFFQFGSSGWGFDCQEDQCSCSDHPRRCGLYWICNCHPCLWTWFSRGIQPGNGNGKLNNRSNYLNIKNNLLCEKISLSTSASCVVSPTKSCCRIRTITNYMPFETVQVTMGLGRRAETSRPKSRKVEIFCQKAKNRKAKNTARLKNNSSILMFYYFLVRALF